MSKEVLGYHFTRSDRFTTLLLLFEPLPEGIQSTAFTLVAFIATNHV
jgi:hypothetical protein